MDIDNVYRPYIMYLTSSQQEELANYIRQTGWNIKTFRGKKFAKFKSKF